MTEKPITLNGDTTKTEADTVRELLKEQSIDAEARGVAIAVNDAVVPRSAWTDTQVNAGDRIEIVKPFRGG